MGVSLRGNVYYLPCFTRETKQLVDVCTQTRIVSTIQRHTRSKIDDGAATTSLSARPVKGKEGFRAIVYNSLPSFCCFSYLYRPLIELSALRLIFDDSNPNVIDIRILLISTRQV